MQSGSKPSLPFKYLEDITNNFAEERILGKGSFGIVYKGLLDNGEMVAVKKLLQATPISLGQLENELILLKKLEHKNIVRLVDHCYETEPTPACQKGKSFLAWDNKILLCLEYLPNGSLDKYIKDVSLNWHTCWKIIEGVSYGLQYLHKHSNEPIVHLDLKPANILLDGNMLPKITDFGMSRLFDKNRTICTAIAGGTPGYMPPEYTRGIITPMWDIFSLGVIIMEVITGHRKYPDDIRNYYEGFIELELQNWRNRLQKEPGFTSHEKDCQLIERCIQIGLICMNPNRNKRPTIKKVIDMLEATESMNVYIRKEAEHALNEQDHGMPNSPGETSSKLGQKDLVFTVKDEPWSKLKQLRDLNNLHGSLKICGLEKVSSREEAVEANLAAKERLTELVLKWDSQGRTCSPEVELQVLESLCPPVGLKKLIISWYKGSTYPDWMVGKTNGGPKDLQELHLYTYVKGPAPQIVEAFPHLRVLWLSGGDWDALPSNMECLTSLKRLTICYNHNIQSLPTLPQSLVMFHLYACGDKFMKSCQTFGDLNWQKLVHIPKKKFDDLSIVDFTEVKLKSFWRRMTW